MLDNLLMVLPLVSSLHDPSMRERHWKRLARETDQHFTFDADFSLGSIMDLNLHLHVPTVEAVWNSLPFFFFIHSFHLLCCLWFTLYKPLG